MKQKVINGVAYEISEPYSEGHVCNEAEARALNQVRAENIGNNLRAKLKELQDAGDADAAKALVAEADTNYIFNHTTLAQRSGKLDPIEREARIIAKDLVKRHLANTGRKLDIAPQGETDDSWAKKVEDTITTQAAREEILTLARENVAKRQKAAEAVAL